MRDAFEAVRTAGGSGKTNLEATIALLLTSSALSAKIAAISSLALASPAMSGTPTAPTATAGTNNTQVATTAFAQALITALVGSAPTGLNTLQKIAAAIGDDPSFVTTISNALAGKVSATDAALDGIPTAPTATAGTNTTQIATTAFVQAAVAALLASAPSTLDTLNELAAALGDDPNFAATVTALIGTKAPLSSPVLEGTPTAPTAPVGTDSTQIATTAFVVAAIAAFGGGGGGDYSGLIDEFGAIQAAGGADLAELSSILSSIITVGGGTTSPATAAQIRQATAGLILVTPQELNAALAPVTLTVTSNVVEIDGTDFINGTATATAATQIGEATNLKNYTYHVLITAASGDQTITAHSSYRPVGFGAGAEIASGKTGIFEIRKFGDDVFCVFIGVTDGSAAIAYLTPALAATPQGHNNGGEIIASAAGLALLFDTAASSTAPPLATNFNSILTQANTNGGNNLSVRLSWKFVSSGEAIPAIAGGSRRIVRIYTNVDAADPIADSNSDGGTSASTDLNVPALTFPTENIPDTGLIVVGFNRRSGTVVTEFDAPLNNNIFTVNTTAAASSGDSGTGLTDYPGQSISIGSSVDWVSAVVALRPAVDGS